MEAQEITQLKAELDKLQTELDGIRKKLELLEPPKEHFADLFGAYPELAVITDEDLAEVKKWDADKWVAEHNS